MSWHAISVVCFRLIHNLGLKHSFQITFPAAFVNHPGYFLQTYVINSRQKVIILQLCTVIHPNWL